MEQTPEVRAHQPDSGDRDRITFLSANYDISTFSIIALMLSIFNIVDLVVSNANNNNNRWIIV